MSVDKYNYKGYKDSTTYEVLSNISKEERTAAIKAVRRPLVYVCSLDCQHFLGQFFRGQIVYIQLV